MIDCADGLLGTKSSLERDGKCFWTGTLQLFVRPRIFILGFGFTQPKLNSSSIRRGDCARQTTEWTFVLCLGLWAKRKLGRKKKTVFGGKELQLPAVAAGNYHCRLYFIIFNKGFFEHTASVFNKPAKNGKTDSHKKNPQTKLSLVQS